MRVRKLKSIRKRIRRFTATKTMRIYMAVGLACAGSVGYAMYMNNRQLGVDPSSYRPLLSLIARAESTGNYNAHFGNPASTSPAFTDMTIEEVQEWQRNFIAQGYASSAVGRYQIIDTTLSELVAELQLSPQQKFDEATQDKLAVALLERRGSVNLVNQKLSPEEFAANLAMEWAALPRVIGDNAEASYYAGDGLNAALVKKEEVLKAVHLLRPR